MLEKYQTLKSFLNIHNEQQIIKLVIILASYPKIIPQIKSQRTTTYGSLGCRSTNLTLLNDLRSSSFRCSTMVLLACFCTIRLSDVFYIKIIMLYIYFNNETT